MAELTIEELKQKRAELVARKNQILSDKMIADLYRTDPEAAKFFLQKQQNEAALGTKLDIARLKPGAVYTSEQKSIIDAKQQNRIRMGEIQGTINTLKTETEKKPWLAQLKTMQERDITLNNALADLKTPGYDKIELTNEIDAAKDGVGKGLTVIAPDNENAEAYLEFVNSFKIDDYKDTSETPDASKIQALARKQKYDLSEGNATSIAKSLDEKVNARNTRKSELAEESRKAGSYARQLAKDKAEVGALSLAYNKLSTNPNDKTYKSSALTSILRKESGASIASSEFLGRMREWLPAADYENLINDMNSIGMLVAGKMSDNAAELFANRIANNYLDKVDTGKMLEFMFASLPDYADVPGKGRLKSWRPVGETTGGKFSKYGKKK